MKKEKKETKDKKIKKSGKGVKTADMAADAVIIAEPGAEELSKLTDVGASASRRNAPAKQKRVRGKMYLTNKKAVEGKIYPPKEAFELLKKVSYSKFPGTVEVHLNLFDKGVSGDVKLPHFEGKAQKVAIFSEELAAEIKLGKVNFDVLLATPADMPKITPLAKVLGPKGLMPSPKAGTVVANIPQAVEEFKKGKMEFKLDKTGNINAAIGKLSFTETQIEENIKAFLKALEDNKPAGVKGKLIKKIFIASTM